MPAILLHSLCCMLALAREAFEQSERWKRLEASTSIANGSQSH